MIIDRIKLVGLYLGHACNWFLYSCFLRTRKKYIKSRRKKRGRIVTYQNYISHNNNYKEIAEYIFSRNRLISKDFVPESPDFYIRKIESPKIIAFYLPQFHRIPENDEWHGNGFTEWTNVTKAIPHFPGHNQPHLPFDMGFYDLSSTDVVFRQVELAKKYGVYGFCFHYYWFSGKRLLERPLFNWLENKKLDFPFCLCWANENWGKLWDGGNKEVLIEQKLDDGDDEKYFNDILCFFKDSRYIRIQGKPVLIIYRPHLFTQERIKVFLSRLVEMAKNNGFNGIYFVMAKTHGFRDDPKDWGFDAAVEFPPHDFGHMPKKKKTFFVNESFKATIYDTEKLIDRRCYMFANRYKVFRTIFPSWDNTARKAYSGAHVFQVTPEKYRIWLKDLLLDAQNHQVHERFVFINAWNEWAEGAHLEPDLKYGYAYLQATKDALEEVEKGGL